ncbi:type VI secretion system baseplate subunit TssG [Legionella impletisoli]|uniref:Type VI secretion protein n=1 Tax=Legionella impletisoli TaxID=343510 RepID=A0A917JXE5_9GAMM|nr:type VI secretion system baseplate subunit TssG [Legionella impletisoli]GGI89788.1 hypothetical protein GCM10007966_18130 [Legionella impletisoli]
MSAKEATSNDFFHTLLSIFNDCPPDEELVFISQKRLTLKTVSSLEFPVRDVAKIIETPNEVIIACQFMGLYGVDSPLPPYFNELCLNERDGGACIQAFLDSLNHRFYALLYLSWQAFRLDKQYIMLHGLEEEKPVPTLADKTFYAATGSLGYMINLCQMILPEFKWDIKECIPDWVRLDEVQALGEQYRLGENSLLGDHIYDSSSKIEIHTGPHRLKYALTLFPGGTIAPVFISEINKSLMELMEFELVVSIAYEPSILVLGQSNIALSYNSILGILADDTYSLRVSKSQYSATNEALYC